MTVPSEPASGSWKTYLRFSVRAMIVLVLVIGTGLGWIVHRARVQRDAVSAIRKAGGGAWYDWQFKNGRGTPKGEPSGPKWLVDALGVDYFGNATIVNGLNPMVTDKELALLGSLDHLEHLNLNGSSVTDAGLVHVRGLTRLESMNLNGTKVSDAGLAHLEQLQLKGTRVTDAGVQELHQALPKVEISR